MRERREREERERERGERKRSIRNLSDSSRAPRTHPVFERRISCLKAAYHDHVSFFIGFRSKDTSRAWRTLPAHDAPLQGCMSMTNLKTVMKMHQL
ncbi:hypothetical protein Hanom_Chr13g01193241 [Helianthus anomalus]